MRLIEQLQGLEITRVELEPLSRSCVRLVAWSGDLRALQLTADPRKPAKLQQLLEVAGRLAQQGSQRHGA